MQTNSLISKLSSPLQQVIYLGAGIGQELPALLDLNAETIHLVEGDEEHQALLESEIECYPQVKLVKKLLSDRTGSATFYRYSLSELNSLQEGTGLQQLFPNVRLVEQQARQTENLIEWLNTLQLQQRDNLIWIDLPGQEAIIIRHLIEHQQLDLFDTLILYAHQQPCYEGQQSIDQIREILADQGYQLQQQNNDVDSDRPLLVMQRHSLYWKNRELQITVQGNMQELTQANELIAKLAEEKQQINANLNQLVSEKEALASSQTELEKLLAELRKASEQSAKAKQEKIIALESQLTEAQKSATANKDAVSKLKSDLDVLTKEKQTISEKLTQLVVEKEKLNTNFQNRKKQAEEGEAKIQSLNDTINLLKEENTALTKRRSELKKQLDEASQKIQLLETKLNTGKETQNGLSALQKQMEYLFEQNRLQLEQATNALGQHISHTGKQTAQELQTFFQCQQRLGHNTQALNYKDQSITPEFALYLNQKLTSNHYDVILVLGSGVLTQFVATQLLQGLSDQKRLSHHSNVTEEGFIEPDQGDLPKRVLSFEHKKSDSKELKKHLQEQDLYSWVNVSHAPLIDCRFGGQDYLYYDLRKPLSRLSMVYEDRHARILTMVCNNQDNQHINHEALLSVLLQELGAHQLEILSSLPVNQMDKILSTWTKVLDARDIDNTMSHNDQIGVLSLRINTN